jgi:competence protein ComEA
MSIRERLDSLSRAELAGLVVVVLITLAGAGLWYARSLPKPIAITAAEPSGASGTKPASAAPVPLVIVDVAGWVRRPGVYEFAEDDRVIDAIERAGGARKGADLAALNLAAPLADGTQVLVPRSGGSASGATAGATSPDGTSLINVNTASAIELEALPGVGEVLAAAIVRYRTEHGPFATVDDLVDVSGIGPLTLEEIRDHTTV